MKDFKIKNTQKCIHSGEKFIMSHTFAQDSIFIMLISTGKCKAILNNTDYTLSAGDFLISVGKGTLRYQFSRNSDALFYTIEASVQKGIHIEETFSLNSGVYRCYDIKSAEGTFSKIVREDYLKSPCSDVKLSALFTQLLCILGESHKEVSSVDVEIIRLADDIHRDFTKSICVNSYADKVGLSKDRFSVIFKNRFGYAPYKYQLMLKMNEATYLLTHTDLSVAKISALLGFSSQLYFSSAYKTQMGCSPIQMRKQQL